MIQILSILWNSKVLQILLCTEHAHTKSQHVATGWACTACASAWSSGPDGSLYSETGQCGHTLQKAFLSTWHLCFASASLSPFGVCSLVLPPDSFRHAVCMNSVDSKLHVVTFYPTGLLQPTLDEPQPVCCNDSSRPSAGDFAADLQCQCSAPGPITHSSSEFAERGRLTAGDSNKTKILTSRVEVSLAAWSPRISRSSCSLGISRLEASRDPEMNMVRCLAPHALKMGKFG